MFEEATPEVRLELASDEGRPPACPVLAGGAREKGRGKWLMGQAPGGLTNRAGAFVFMSTFSEAKAIATTPGRILERWSGLARLAPAAAFQAACEAGLINVCPRLARDRDHGLVRYGR
jgi:hypothetical protein